DLVRLDGRGVDREEDEHLGAEVLLDGDIALDRPGRRMVVLGQREMLWTNTENDSLGKLRAVRAERGKREGEAREAKAALGDVRLDEVHRRRADERGDEEVQGRPAEALRRIDLLDPAFVPDGGAR